MIWISLKKVGQSPKIRKEHNKNYQNYIKKNPSRGITLRKIWIKYYADWNIFMHKNPDTVSVTHTKRLLNDRIIESQTYKSLVITLFRRCENPQKNQLIRRKRQSLPFQTYKKLYVQTRLTKKNSHTHHM